MVGLASDTHGWRDTGAASDSNVARGPPAEAEDDLSPEDAAWADSCLVKDDDRDGGTEGKGEQMSDDAWASLTEAFINALAYSASSGNATAIQEEEEEEKVDESFSLMDASREASRANASGDDVMSEAGASASETANGLFQADAAITEAEEEEEEEEEETSSSPTAASTYVATFYDQPPPTLGDPRGEGPSAMADDQLEGTEEGSNSNGRAAVVIGNEFPDEQRGYGDGEEEEFSMAGGEEEVELTRDIIFRVWELNVVVPKEEEEEELGWQLKRALEGSSVMPPPAEDPILDDDDGWKKRASAGAVSVLDDDENLEQLIAGITHISLVPGDPPPPPRDPPPHRS